MSERRQTDASSLSCEPIHVPPDDTVKQESERISEAASAKPRKQYRVSAKLGLPQAERINENLPL
jgi:hypothetical protein